MQDKIAALFSAWDSTASPGVVWAATMNGVEVASGAVGMADIAQQTRLDRRSVIRIGSQSKQFTVLLALMLEQEGKLDMAQSVRHYLPWLPTFASPITLQHLATNTSGLRDFLEIMTYSGLPLSSPISRTRQHELIAAHGEVNFPPGERMIYCNTGFALLSDIVEQVSGRSYNDLLAERITLPLGMRDTRLVSRDAEIWPRLAVQHLRNPTGWETTRWGFDLGGEGGMVSTLNDMLTWQGNFANPVVGSKALFDRMATPVVYNNGVLGKYAMGLTREDYRGQDCVAHGGGVAGGKSESVRFPQAGLGVVLLANFDAIVPNALTRAIADIILGLQPLGSPEMARLAGAAGFYRQPGTGEILAISNESGTPYCTIAGGSHRLEEIGVGVFVPERAAQHNVVSLTSDGSLAGHFCGAPVHFVPVARPAGPYPSIVGRYANSATGMSVRIDPALRMWIGTEAGQVRLVLRWVDHDLLAGIAETVGHTTAWPPNWSCSVQVVADGLVFTTDRTKALLLRRIG